MSHFQNSLLPVAARFIVPVQFAFSIYLLLRGHNLPGGGFIGGLVMASAIVLRVMVHPERALRVDLIALAGMGLLVAATSALAPVFIGQPFFTGLWGGELWLPTVGKLKLGTPLLFDIGVYLVVTGVGAKMLLVLLSEHHAAVQENIEK
jgi:multicomponent Na+:H+ antiporter subunit B